MTTTPPSAPFGPADQEPPTTDNGPRLSAEQIRDMGRLRRSRTDRKVAGVAGGLGRHLDIDPTILRVAFVVLTFIGGAGFLMYVACWLLVPEDNDAEAMVKLDERNRLVALAVVAAVAAMVVLGYGWGGGPSFGLVPVVVIAIGLVYLMNRRDKPISPAGPASAPWTSPGDPVADQPSPGQSTYQPFQAPTAPYGTAPGYPPYGAVPPTAAYAPVPRDPRKGGPILFWFTLALIALAMGLLGIIDSAPGVDIASSAYPALALGLTGLMLVIGAFWGRAGGLILVGLILAVVLAGSTAADRWNGQAVLVAPLTAAALNDSYSVEVGEFTLDLSEVADLDALDRRTVAIDVSLGQIRVILPEELGVRIEAEVSGPGRIELFGNERSGFGTEFNQTSAAPDGRPQLTIRADVEAGEIVVLHPTTTSIGSLR